MSSESGTSVRLQIGHVLFMDLVAYSTQLLDEQRQYQEELNEIVRGTEQVRSAKEAGKLIRLPAGDGMALVFFDSLEAPVRCAMEISKKLKEYPQLKLRMNRRNEALQTLKAALANRAYSAGDIPALVHVALGAHDDAIRDMERACEEHSSSLHLAGIAPEFAPLRSDKRFVSIVKRIGLEPQKVFAINFQGTTASQPSRAL